MWTDLAIIVAGGVTGLACGTVVQGITLGVVSVFPRMSKLRKKIVFISLLATLCGLLAGRITDCVEAVHVGHLSHEALGLFAGTVSSALIVPTFVVNSFLPKIPAFAVERADLDDVNVPPQIINVALPMTLFWVFFLASGRL